MHKGRMREPEKQGRKGERRKGRRRRKGKERAGKEGGAKRKGEGSNAKWGRKTKGKDNGE